MRNRFHCVQLDFVSYKMRCVAACCDNNHFDRVSFHRFPKDEYLRKKWIVAVSRTRRFFKGSAHSVLCSDHFTAADYEPRSFLGPSFGLSGRNMMRLKAGAIPRFFMKPIPILPVVTLIGNENKKTRSTIMATKENQKGSTKRTRCMKELIYSTSSSCDVMTPTADRQIDTIEVFEIESSAMEDVSSQCATLDTTRSDNLDDIIIKVEYDRDEEPQEPTGTRKFSGPFHTSSTNLPTQEASLQKSTSVDTFTFCSLGNVEIEFENREIELPDDKTIISKQVLDRDKIVENSTTLKNGMDFKDKQVQHKQLGQSECSNLEKHMRKHTSELPIPCEHCGLRFRDIEVLEKHMRKHQYECEICGKKITKMSSLTKHMRMRTDKPF